MSSEESRSVDYRVKSLGEIMIPMRDGVKLAADVYAPDAEGKYPALVAYGIWHKELAADLQWKYPPQPPPSFLWAGSVEGGDSEYLVTHGYVHVMVQSRGRGHSEGVERGQDRRRGHGTDFFDTIEWIAKQPWCDGNVGMIGISAFASTQLQAAIERPPHLKAIFPYDTPSDFYRDGTYDGGVLSLFHQGPRPAPKSIDAEKIGEMERVALEIRKKVLSGSSDFMQEYAINDLLVSMKLYDILMHPRGNPNFFNTMMHPFDGKYWQEMSLYPNYDEITIPVYCGAGWYAGSYVHLIAAFRNWAGLTKTKAKKMIIGPDAHGPGDRWVHLERPWHQYHDEIIRWYDYWLKGKDTGIMDEPPIKLWVMGANRWRYENEWPLARTKWTNFYLQSFKRLNEELPRATETSPDAFVQQPLNTTNEVGKLEYQTSPLSKDVEVTGPITMYLYGAIHTENKKWVDTNWIVSLKDVLLNKEERELARGWLKASHRALDAEKSKPWQPYHPHTEEALERIETDKIYEFAIELRPTSNVFERGHRIKIDIQSAELPAVIADIANHLGRNDVVLHKVYRSREYPSHVLLPIIPISETSQWLDEERAKHLPGLFDGTATRITHAGAY